MRKLAVFMIFIGIILIGGSGFFFIKSRQTSPSALQVTSVPKAIVFLDGQELGRTPLMQDVPAGEHTLKIIPEEINNISFEEKVSFSPNILTVVDRSFEQTGSSGYVLTLVPLSDNKQTELTVLSTPSSAGVSLDSELKGITPILLQNITASDHELLVSKEGFFDKSIRVKSVMGHKLVANVDLAPNLNPAEEIESTPSAEISPTATPASNAASPSANIISQSKVKILSTPNNFLRVREEPSLSARELGRVKPGETFPMLDENNQWFKIILPDGIEGWISSQFAQKISQ